MRFAIINSVCGFGSTGRNVIKNQKRLKERGHDAIIFYGLKRNIPDQDNQVFFGSNRVINAIRQRIDMLLGISGMVCLVPTLRLFLHLKKYNPDVVWLNNIHGGYVNEFLLLEYLKKNNIMTVYGMPDEYAFLGKCCCVTDCKKFMDDQGCRKCPMLRSYPISYLFDNSQIKFRLKQKAYTGFDKIVFRSAPYVIGNARKSTLLSGKEMYESDSSVDTENIFYPRDTKKLREKYSLSGNTVVILICAPYKDPLKGVQYLIEAAKECVNDDILFLNVSFGGDASICPSNYIPLPYEKDKSILAEYYSLADAYVCTSLSDAQPNTCLEALACGTPIIGFNISGIPYIAPNEFGTFVEPRNAHMLACAIKSTPKKTAESITRCREYARNRFSIEASENRYNAFLKIVCEKAIAK